jgi:hypothetical protein
MNQKRFEFSGMTPSDALEAAFARLDETDGMLVIASRSDQPTSFGAIITRETIPEYL